MRISVGLILYILVSIIGGLIKKAAEDKSQGQPRVKTQVGKHGQSYPDTVSHEEIERALVQRFQEIIPEEQAQQIDADAERQAVPTELETEEEPKIVSKERKKQRIPSLQPSLAQAVVMSEIIRQPRAKRPWPSR